MITLLGILCTFGAFFSAAFFWVALGRGAAIDGTFYGVLTVAFSFIALSCVVPDGR